ncbi:MAG: winged helix-turn-helix transcriptional regulator [Nitrosopumilus sp.]
MDEQNINTEKVLQYIQANPGSHLREIKRELGMAMGTIQYHLDLLEKQGKILSERQNFRKSYFPIGQFGENQRNVLKIIKQDTAREILLFIIEKKNPTQQEIVTKIQISAASVTWHLDRLKKTDIIYELRDGKYKHYYLKIKPTEIIQLIQNYHPTIWDQWSGRLIETFLSLSGDEEK